MSQNPSLKKTKKKYNLIEKIKFLTVLSDESSYKDRIGT